MMVVALIMMMITIAMLKDYDGGVHSDSISMMSSDSHQNYGDDDDENIIFMMMIIVLKVIINII